MISVNPSSVLAIMFLLHFFADFNLQIHGRLDKFKQAKWWSEQIPKGMSERERLALWRKFRYDYVCGLLCHGFYWALIVCLPHLVTCSCSYAFNVILHGLLHAFIDDLKCNRGKLNLWEDQLMHAAQLVFIWLPLRSVFL